MSHENVVHFSQKLLTKKDFETLREGSRGFERLRKASRGFERVREGSRGFERVREVSSGLDLERLSEVLKVFEKGFERELRRSKRGKEGGVSRRGGG